MKTNYETYKNFITIISYKILILTITICYISKISLRSHTTTVKHNSNLLKIIPYID